MKRTITFVELLVVVIVVSLVIGLGLPLRARAQEEGRKATCKANLAQIGKALALYAGDNEGWTPEFGAGLILTNPEKKTDYTPPKAAPGEGEIWWNFGAMDNSWSVSHNNVVVGQPQPWLASPAKPGRPILLGLLWAHGYMGRRSGEIVYCPSNDSGAGSKEEGYDTVFSYDADEPFWTSNGQVRRGDADKLGNPNSSSLSQNGCYDGEKNLGEPICWVMTNYSVRYYAANEVRYGRNLREEPQAIKKADAAKIGLYSDNIELWGAVRIDGYGQGGNTKGAPEDDPGWKSYAVVNHDKSWNVLFGDGSVKTFSDSEDAVFNLIIQINNLHDSCIVGPFAWLNHETRPNEPLSESAFTEHFDTAYGH